MQLLVLGLNHKTAPVEVRERFSLSESKIKAGLRNLENYVEISEAVILSTCNRSEIYVVLEDSQEGLSVTKQFFFDLANNVEDVDTYLYSYTDKECIEHLFRVSASLDSLIIGEGQILSQVKNAYAIAREIDTTSTVLNTLFHRAIAVGKRVRTETRIAFSAVSVSYAAVELAKKIFGDLSQSRVLLLGAGKMGELTATHLVSSGAKCVIVANRHYERAVELAKKFKGSAITFEHAMECAETVDIIITSTGAPHYIIKEWETKTLMRKRKGKKMFFIDIAVPRDVAPEVADIPGVNLYNIDDLEAVVDSNMRIREQEAQEAEMIIQKEVEMLLDKFQYLAFRPVMELLTDKANDIRQRAVKRAFAKLPALTEADRRVVENMSKLIVRKILREPMVQMNNAAGTGNEQYYIDAMRDLFKLDLEVIEGANDENEDCYRYARQ